VCHFAFLKALQSITTADGVAFVQLEPDRVIPCFPTLAAKTNTPQGWGTHTVQLQAANDRGSLEK
jgi:hypothetical protein